MYQPGLVQRFQTFPPAFESNPFAYGFALFGLILLAAVSLAEMVRIARAAQPSRNGWLTNVTMFRLMMFSLYATIFTLTWPDIMVLLLWNEVSDATMEGLWATDRLFDGLAILPFLAAFFIAAKRKPQMVEQLIMAPSLPRVDFMGKFHLLRMKVLMIAVIAFIAAGVALGKLWGAV